MTDPPRVIPAADSLPVRREATVGFRLARTLIGPLYRLLFRLRVTGNDRIPQGRPYILVSNHLNWLDPFTLLLAFPVEPRLHFLADPENLVKNRWHWWIVRKVGGYIPVDLKRHQDRVLFEQVHKGLAKGVVVTIFPEAVYGPAEGKLQPFKKGFAHFAVDSHVPVLPVALSGTKDLWFGKKIELRIGSVIETEGLEVDELVEMARDRVEELLPRYEEPPGRKPFRRLLTRLLY